MLSSSRLHWAETLTVTCATTRNELTDGRFIRFLKKTPDVYNDANMVEVEIANNLELDEAIPEDRYSVSLDLEKNTFTLTITGIVTIFSMFNCGLLKSSY